MSGNGTRTGGLDGELLPCNDGGLMKTRQLYAYWEAGYHDGRDGLPPLRWMKNSWPEDGRESYYEGHKAGMEGAA